MRTITFEVEVDDEIIPSFVPNIYDEVFKQTPHGRLFLCKDRTSVAKKLVRLHRDAEAGGKEAPWFENIYLPDETRIVRMTGGNAADYVQGPANSEAHDNDAKECITLSTLHEDHRLMVEDLCDIKELIGLIKMRQANIMENQEANRDGMYAKFEEDFKHFKQVHEYHDGEIKYFAEAEDRMTRSIVAEVRNAADTANTVGHDILRALHELEGRIKECVGHTGATPSAVPAPPLTTDDRELMLNVILQQQRTVDYYRMCVKGLQDKLNSKLNPED